MNVIEATGLGKSYRRSWALRDASLAIPAGHVVALVGPNGAGKATLLHTSVGLTMPTASQVTDRAAGQAHPGVRLEQHPLARAHRDPRIGVPYLAVGEPGVLHPALGQRRRAVLRPWAGIQAAGPDQKFLARVGGQPVPRLAREHHPPH